MFRRRPKPPTDWFACPVCGSDVPVGAVVCRECGSDDSTGWSRATEVDDLDLPEPEGVEIPETFEQFERLAEGRRRRLPPWIVLAILFFSIFVIVVNAILARL